MGVHQNSLDNLRPLPAYPVGGKRQVGNYWMVKQENGKWEYTHKVLATQLLGRPLRPNERVYFTEQAGPSSKEDPQPGDIEVRVIPPKNGATPGKRRKLIKRIRQAEYDLELMKEELARQNGFYGKAPDDREDAGIPASWQPRPPRPLSGLD